MIILETDRLILRNWVETDRDLFHEINADRKVMEYFPFRRTRSESDLLFDKVRGMIAETGFGFHAIALAQTNEPMGFCGLSQANLDPPFARDAVEIGWRLATRFWGNGYVTEAAGALVDHGFARMGLEAIISFAVESNRRSTAVMRRIGMSPDPGRDFDHPRVPDSHPHLKRHAFYEITRQQWTEKAANAASS